MAEETQTYYAKSMFSDPVMIASFIIAALQLNEINQLIPEAWVHGVTAFTALLNLYLRFQHAQRPVAFIPPTQVKPVEVKSLKETTT